MVGANLLRNVQLPRQARIDPEVTGVCNLVNEGKEGSSAGLCKKTRKLRPTTIQEDPEKGRLSPLPIPLSLAPSVKL
jgi:hypothetical protein